MSETFDRERRRKFGQNFLNNPTLTRAIAGDLPAKAGDLVVEIGPGHGALTEFLLERQLRVRAFDIDGECVSLLKKKFAGRDFEANHQNFLEADLEPYADQNAWLAGNLPYNVGTTIVTKSMEQLSRFGGAMFMLQLEVIERMAARPGTKEFGSLSVFCQGHAHVKILRKVDPENFSPKPNVMSATALFLPKPASEVPPPEFFEFSYQAFRQKRKTLQNNLGELYPKAAIAAALVDLGLNPASRGEELDVETFRALWTALEPERKTHAS